MRFFSPRLLLRLLLLVAGLGPWACFGQNATIDSLARLIARSTARDTQYVNLLNDYAWELIEHDPDVAVVRLNEAMSIAKSLGFLKGEAMALNALGVVAEIKEDFDLAIQHYQSALTIRKQLGDQKGVAALYNNLGNTYEAKGEYGMALKHHRDNLLIVEALNDEERIARANYNIGLVLVEEGSYLEAYQHINEYRGMVEKKGDFEGMGKAYNMLGNIRFELEMLPEARKWFEQSLQMAEKMKEPAEIANAHNSLGNVLDEMDSTQAAIGHYRKAWDIRRGLNDRIGMAGVFNNLGTAYKHLKQYDQALNYLKQSMQITKELNYQQGLMEVCNSIGDVYFGKGQLDEALDYTGRYFAIAQKIQNDKFVQKGYKDFAKLYAAKGNYKKAYEYRVLYDELRYSRLDERRSKDFERREVLFSDGKKQLEIEKTRQKLLVEQAKVAQSVARQNALIGGAVALGLLVLLLVIRIRLRNKANRDLAAKNAVIERERARADDLLMNILPFSAAQELKQNATVKPERYESATVMFTDFKSFTQVAEHMPPEELVAELDECFRLFDAIMEEFDIEKIKTIGDAYMCVGGVPQRNETHALDVVKAAIAMQQRLIALMAQKKAAGKPIFEMRIGIHSGPVVAGVVGMKKFAYDIWGDTVNTAARMESGSEVGKINISETTYALVKDHFRCTFRGKIMAKNKGEISMYFLEY